MVSDTVAGVVWVVAGDTVVDVVWVVVVIGASLVAVSLVVASPLEVIVVTGTDVISLGKDGDNINVVLFEVS